MNKISRDNSKPIYMQLRDILRSKIESKVFPPGSMIPSENDLAKTYDINRQTVRSALSILVKEGILKKVQGKGVFVDTEKSDELLGEDNIFTLDIESKNDQLNKRVIAKFIRRAGDLYGSLFNIPGDSLLLYTKTVTTYEDNRNKLEEYYTPLNYISNYSDIEFSLFNIEDLLQSYGIELIHFDQKIEIVDMNRRDRKYLNTALETGIIENESSYYDKDDNLILIKKSYSPMDKTSFLISFKNQNNNV